MSPETYAIAAESRSAKARSLRRRGFLPVVLYGHGVESVAASVKRADFERLMQSAGQSSIVMVTLNDEHQPRPALIQDVQFDPVRDNPVHADFYQVRMDEAIEASVPLEFVGDSRAVKEAEGILVKNVQELEVRALPMHLPHSIVVSLASLENIDDMIRVTDLSLPDGVEVLTDPETVVVAVAPPRSEEELAALDEKPVEDVEAVEVAGAKEKAEEAAGEAGEEAGAAEETKE